MATILCRKITDDKDAFKEVKCQQRSNVVNYVLWLPHLVTLIPLIQVNDDDDLNEVTNRHRGDYLAGTELKYRTCYHGARSEILSSVDTSLIAHLIDSLIRQDMITHRVIY